MRYISASWVAPIASAPIPKGVVGVDDDGHIQFVGEREDLDDVEIEFYEGILIPGFINTHCHLELSHLLGKVDTGTGLIPFITGVLAHRDASDFVKQTAIETADAFMYEAGIQAVGDISNGLDTAEVKRKSKIRYSTFVEMFDFLQDDNAQATYDQYKAVFDGFDVKQADKISLVPHAPYSVSASLYKLINQGNTELDCTISIHNQETPPENELFESGTGGFVDFYSGFDISLDGFEKTCKPSIYFALEQMDASKRTLFVHNTLTSAADIAAAHSWNAQTFWATCPNANLYIENRLPNYQLFMDAEAKMTIGTDSLTSNWQLSVLEEMKAIARYQSYVPFSDLLEWSTLNGATALGFDELLGSFEIGKQPGLILLEGSEEFELLQETTVRRLV